MEFVEEEDENFGEHENSDVELNDLSDGLIISIDEDASIKNQRMRQMQKELGLIRLSWPTAEYDDPFLAQLPLSYRSNDEKEKLLLWYAENFRKQYRIVYPDRKPLVLACDNECNVQKFVSTSIRPSTLPYPELQNWQGCAKFVSDHVTYEPLSRPLSMPDKICSPTWLMTTQRGNSFECATLLCSLLIGRHYNAFVVSGYASREQTLNDTSMLPCPYFKKSNDSEEKIIDENSKKYELKAPPNFRSKLLDELEEKERQRVQNEQDQLEIERQREMAEREQPRPDEFWGHRVHAWILILPDNETDGSRHPEVNEPFFIEPSSGQHYEINKDINLLYHGIESVWNNANYWVNIQLCTGGCQELNWEFWNNKMWEHLLPGEPWSFRGVNEDDKTDEDLHIMQEKHLDMPVSYLQEIEIHSLDFERRFPNGRKTTFYKKTKAEVFAPYVQMDGLIEKITIYNDYEYELPVKVFEKYANRGDRLCKSTKDLENGSIVDEYKRGRIDACKVHRYTSMRVNSIEDERTLDFYSVVRNDGLEKIVMHPDHISQYYVGRKDLLCYRRVEFTADKGPIAAHNIHWRKIMKITEEFKRNPELPAKKDIAIREFSFVDDEIRLKYHYKDDEITRATRTFIKPPVAERGDRLVFDPTMTHGYDPDPLALPEKPLDLFYLLENQLNEEEKVVNCVRDAEKEIDEFLKSRKQEYLLPKLFVSIFDLNRNQDAKAGLSKKEEMARVQAQRQVDEEVDYLGPYLSKLGNPKTLSKFQILQIRQECLGDFKHMLTNRANDIWRKYEISRCKFEELQKYRSQADELSPEEDEKLSEEINKINLKMHTLDLRLKRHCDLSSYRYQAMIKNLNNDKRLSSSPQLIS